MRFYCRDDACGLPPSALIVGLEPDKCRKLANRFKDAKDPFRTVIVHDMWLTGFDAPCLHTMYDDGPGKDDMGWSGGREVSNLTTDDDY